MGRLAMKPRGKFVPFTEMADRWGYSEDELIQLAIEMEEFNLYCLKPIPGNTVRIPFYIGNELSDFLPGNPRISCSQFWFKTSDSEEGTFITISPEDRMIADISRASYPELNQVRVTVDVDRVDLYLHRDEIALMEASYPELAGVKARAETEASDSEVSNTANQLDVWNVQPLHKKGSTVIRRASRANKLQSINNSETVFTSSTDCGTAATHDNQLLSDETDKDGDLSANAEKPNGIEQSTPIEEPSLASSGIIRRRTRAERQLSKDSYESEPSPSPELELELVATLDNQLSLPEEIDKKIDLSAKAEKPKRTKQQKKKNEKLDIHNVDEVGEPIPICKNEKELPPSKSQPAPDERYLCKDEIIGDKNKGIKGIIPMSNSKWYKGIEKGIFPKQIKVGNNSYWKISEIQALQKRMEKGELDPNHTA